MRVFAKKTYKFTNGSESRTTEPLAFCDLPDWVKKDPLFRWAIKDGTLEVIKTPKQQVTLENEPNKDKSSNSETSDPHEDEGNSNDDESTEPNENDKNTDAPQT